METQRKRWQGYRNYLGLAQSAEVDYRTKLIDTPPGAIGSADEVCSLEEELEASQLRLCYLERDISLADRTLASLSSAESALEPTIAPVSDTAAPALEGIQNAEH